MLFRFEVFVHNWPDRPTRSYSAAHDI